MNTELKKKLTATDKWLRLLFMVIYLVVNYVAQFIIWALAAVQFIFALLTGSANHNLLSFTRGLNAFCYQILQYATYNSQEKPYPFGNWPKGE
jgi:Domain of unknown function (DUF4389)